MVRTFQARAGKDLRCMGIKKLIMVVMVDTYSKDKN